MVIFRSLSVEDNLVLIAPFMLEKLDGVLSQYDENKSPGPYEFNFSFVKRLWTLIRVDVGVMFDVFHRFASLPHCFFS